MATARVHPGQLDRQVTLQVLSETKDAYGEPAETWSTVATLRARKDETSGRETVFAGRIGAQQAVMWTLRYSSVTAAVSPATYRLLFATALGSEVYEIHGAREIGRGRYVELTTTRTGRMA